MNILALKGILPDKLDYFGDLPQNVYPNIYVSKAD
jgi:hypothetical protein